MLVKCRFLLLVMVLCSGSLFSQAVYETLPRVDFCDLPKFKGQLVEVTAVYSGVDENWSIGPGPSQNCSSKYKVELNLSKYDKTKTPDEFNKTIDSVYANQNTSYLIITMLGVFQTGKKGGYGQQGANNAEFVVEKVENVKLVRKN